LAGYSVEEVGKAVSLGLLAAMPENLKAQAPVGRMLGWHQWKQVEGQVLAAVPYLPPEIAPKLLTMPEADLAKVISEYEVQAEEADRFKRSGLYVDISHGARIREPAEITEAEAARQLAHARRAVTAARILGDQKDKARLPNPSAARARIAQAAVHALAGIGRARDPDEAADVMRAMIRLARTGD
jgi:AbiV family abortive infection protein